MAVSPKSPQDAIADARAIVGWNDHSVITVLCDFISAQGASTVNAFAKYVEARIAEEEEAASDLEINP